MNRRALVLSGGGAKGAFELGAIDYLVNDRGLDFEVITGVSTGCLNASYLSHASDQASLRWHVEKLKEIWFGIRSERDIFRRKPLGSLGAFLFKYSSLYDSLPLRQLIQKFTDPTFLAASAKRLRIGVVSLQAGTYFSIPKTAQPIQDYILASATMPFFFPPVVIVREGKRHQMLDGGLRDITPLGDAYEALGELERERGPGDEPDEIFVILASPVEPAPTSDEFKDVQAILRRTVEILTNEIYQTDLKVAEAINQARRFYDQVNEALTERLGEAEAHALLDRAPFPFAKHRYARLIKIAPEEEVIGTLEFRPEKIRAAFEYGRARAQVMTREVV